MKQREKSHTHGRGLTTIAAFKLLKAVALLTLGFGELHYLHRDLAMEVAHWVDLLRVDPHNHYITWLLEKVSNVDPHRLKELSVGTFVYAGLFICEGTGLALRKRWAEYLTIVSTASLLPIEVYEIFVKPSAGKVLVLIVNIAIVIYLVWVVRETKHPKAQTRK
jgi:uncharacterized membrane protein (DUF2068 family)